MLVADEERRRLLRETLRSLARLDGHIRKAWLELERLRPSVDVDVSVEVIRILGERGYLDRLHKRLVDTLLEIAEYHGIDPAEFESGRGAPSGFEHREAPGAGEESAHAAADRFLERAGLSNPRLRQLTNRQRQVLVGILSGQTSRQIASELAVSERTVEVHRAKLLHALGARNSQELFRLLLQFVS